MNRRDTKNTTGDWLFKVSTDWTYGTYWKSGIWENPWNNCGEFAMKRQKRGPLEEDTIWGTYFGCLSEIQIEKDALLLDLSDLPRRQH